MSIETKDTGVRLRVFVQPQSSKNQIIGWHQDEIKIKLTSPPVEGAANEALVAFLAKLLKIAKNRIELVKGHTSRHKVVDISDITAEEIKNILGL